MIWLISSKLILLTMLSAGLVFFFLDFLHQMDKVNLIFRRFSMIWTPEFLFLKAINQHISNHFLELSRNHFLYGFICFCLYQSSANTQLFILVMEPFPLFASVEKKHVILARFSWHLSLTFFQYSSKLKNKSSWDLICRRFPVHGMHLLVLFVLSINKLMFVKTKNILLDNRQADKVFMS